jgi:hypothetical protein
MRATTMSTKIDGLTFTRDHYVGQPSYRERAQGITTEALNNASAWRLTVPVSEINSDLQATGETVGIEIKVWANDSVVKIEGVERMKGPETAAVAKALAAAAKLVAEFEGSERCPWHGTTPDGDGPAFDCEGCFLEQLSPSELQQHLEDFGTEHPGLALALHTRATRTY